MAYPIAFETRPKSYFKALSWLAMLMLACFASSCSDDDPRMIVEPDTYVYLVMLNDEPELQSLTIIDSLNGKGTMVVPDIPAHSSNRFDLIIDRVDDSRANIAASQSQVPDILRVTGAGFFTNDSIYVELTIDGFSNRDILAGSR